MEKILVLFKILLILLFVSVLTSTVDIYADDKKNNNDKKTENTEENNEGDETGNNEKENSEDDKKVEVNIISFEENEDDKNKDKDDKTIIDIQFNEENIDNDPKINNKKKPKFDMQKMKKLKKHYAKNKNEKKLKKNELKYDVFHPFIKRDSTTFAGQIRIDLNVLLLHIDDDEIETISTDKRSSYNVMGGFGIEYLITDRWGILTGFGIGTKEEEKTNNITRTQILFDFHIVACYHFYPFNSLDLYFQAGFGSIVSNILVTEENDGNNSYSFSEDDLEALQYSILGLGVNYFFTDYFFAGVEVQYLLKDFGIKDADNEGIAKLNVEKFFWRIKGGFAF